MLGDRIVKLLVLCLSLLCVAGLHATSLEEGNRAFTEGKFEEAAAAYRKAIDGGLQTANAWYNLGNAEYRLGNKGQAMLAYQRALVLDPVHPEALFNLGRVQQETGARIEQIPAWEDAIRLPERWFGKDGLPWIGAGLFWLMVFCLVPLFGRRKVWWLRASLAGLAFAWVLVAFMLEWSRGPLWLVTEGAARAQSAPVDAAKPVGSALPPGSELRLLQERGDWVYVVLPDDLRGWLPRKVVEPVIPAGTGERSGLALLLGRGGR